MQSSYKPKYEYSCDEWVRDFDYFFRSPNGSNKTELLKYFSTLHRESPKVGCWKMNRCGMALDCLMRNLSIFEEFIVQHEGKALVSAPIVRGLWRYYGGIPDEHLAKKPNPELILELAREEAQP